MGGAWRGLEAAIDSDLTRALFLLLAYVLGLKALNLRRVTSLGVALMRNNLAFAAAYLGAFLAEWVPLFRTDAWTYGARLTILVTALGVLREMARAFGGWRALHRRAWLNLRDMLLGRDARHQGGDEGY